MRNSDEINMNEEITSLCDDEIDSVGGGPVPFLVIPLVAIATHLASEYYHHHA